MRIGIIGAGKMGAALGKIWAKAGHHVIFSYKLRQLAAAAGETAQAGTPQEAVAHSNANRYNPAVIASRFYP
jgi:8-hydroxy-5-deazaflavin:NADPH oxidoreductase